ncbi:hypothetical protein Tco_1041042 [Tanacetum coccineum]|uniref:Xylulose kinase-1 n=1 Tax=Tanacetum coccineum TaxID=301880 RepID=A0ABQ5GHI2_9ASTR
MTTLKFADTHNMVAFLAKPTESEGFEQIVDFLNAHTIKYTLTVNPTIYTSCIEQFWATVKAKTVNGEVQLQALVDGKKIIITESIVRRDLQLEDAEGVDCLPNATIFKQLTLMGSKTTAWNEFSSTMASAIICLATNQKFNFSKYIFESMVKNLDNVSGNFLMYPRLRRSKRKDIEVPQPSGPTTNVADEAVNEEMDDSLVRAATTASSLESEQDSGNIDKTQSKATPNEPSSSGTSSGGGPRRQETMGDTIAQTRSMNVQLYNHEFLALEATKVRLANDIADEEDLGEDASKQGRRIHNIDTDEDITLVNDDNEMFDVGTLTGNEVLVEQVVATKDVNLSVDEVTLAQALAALKSAKVQEKGDVIKEPSVPVSVVSASTKDSTAITITAIILTPRKGIIFQELEQPSQANVQDKGKGKMVEPEKPMKKKELIRLDEEIASKLQAEFDEEVRLAREKGEKEQEANVVLTKEWNDIQAKIEADHKLAQRLKHFAAKRVEEKRNKPPTQAQQRKIMCTYLKNMEGKKPKDLKNKSFDSIQKMFDKAFKRQKVDDDKETAELKSLLEVMPDEEEVALDAIPLAVKSPSIVDWKIHKEGKKSYYQIIRADGSSKMYLVFSHMLKSFDKEDLETLYKLVKAKYGSTRLVEDLDLVSYGDLKAMFEPHVEDNGRIVRIKRLLDDLGVTAAQSSPPKTSHLVDDDIVEEEAIEVSGKKPLGNDIEDETLEIYEIVNINEFKSSLLDSVIGNLNQRTLRSQAQDKSNFFCFLSTIEPKNVSEALKDESWVVAMQEELNKFTANDVWELVPQPKY